MVSVVFHKWLVFCCVQNGLSARRGEGACPHRPVTEPQRRRQPIFNATLRAGRLLAIFRVARSASVNHTQAHRSRLENRQNPLRQNTSHL